MVSNLLQQNPSDQLPRIRGFVKAQLRLDPQLRFYDKYRATFLMTDAFPDEAHRFPLDSTQLRLLVHGA